MLALTLIITSITSHSTICVPGTDLSILHILTLVYLTITFGGRYAYYSHFIEFETEAQN